MLLHFYTAKSNFWEEGGKKKDDEQKVRCHNVTIYRKDHVSD